MSETRFSLGAHELQLVRDGRGKERIIYDNKTVSEKRNLGRSSRHQFEATESGELAKYDVTFKASLSGLNHYTVKRNDVLVKKGAISTLTGGLLRIFFFFIGLGLVCNSLYVVFWYSKFIVSLAIPGNITLLYIDAGIECIFGIFFLILAFLWKIIIFKIPKLITTVLWLRIGLMFIGLSSFILKNLIQGNNFLDYKLLQLIVMKVGFIWVFWLILENVKQIALGLRETPNQ